MPSAQVQGACDAANALPTSREVGNASVTVNVPDSGPADVLVAVRVMVPLLPAATEVGVCVAVIVI